MVVMQPQYHVCVLNSLPITEILKKYVIKHGSSYACGSLLRVLEPAVGFDHESAVSPPLACQPLWDSRSAPARCGPDPHLAASIASLAPWLDVAVRFSVGIIAVYSAHQYTDIPVTC